MKTYVVIGTYADISDNSSYIYGVFSSEQQAKETKEKLCHYINPQVELISIVECILDKPTEFFDITVEEE